MYTNVFPTQDVEARIHIILTYAVHARPLLCEVCIIIIV